MAARRRNNIPAASLTAAVMVRETRGILMFPSCCSEKASPLPSFETAGFNGGQNRQWNKNNLRILNLQP